jgi:pimeloyl-ACP methyl ester carboxylesterase
LTTFVLVHGAWLGGWSWRRVRPLLTEAGCEVFTPTLTGLGERAHLIEVGIDLDLHIQDILGLLDCEDLHDVVLVGHSYGGMVITGVADRAGRRLRELVYLDAFVPHNGQSILDLSPPELVAQFREQAAMLGGGWRVPPLPLARWGINQPADLDWLSRRLGPQPLRTFDQRLRIGPHSADGIGRSYIRCAAYPGFERFGDQARDGDGWRYRELGSSHLAMITHPEELTRMLLELSGDGGGQDEPA